MIRYAIHTITDPKQDAVERARVIEAYMPSNYSAFPVIADSVTVGVLIVGEDSHGWTLDDYVLPRLASGLYFAREIDADAANMHYTRYGAM
jgi:hypothetical protein